MKLICTFLLVFILESLMSQSIFHPEIAIGANRSDGTSSIDAVTNDQFHKSNIGFHSALFNRFKIYKKFTITPEIGYQYISFKKTSISAFGDKMQSFHNGNVTLKFEFELLKKLTLKIGPSINFLLNKPSLIPTKAVNPNVLTGLQYYFYKDFSIGFDYTFSITNYNELAKNVLFEQILRYLDYSTIYLTIPLKFR